MNITEFAEEIKQEVLSRCTDEDSPHFREDKFTEVFIEYLQEANELDDGDICYFKHNSRGEKLNAFNISNDGEYLDLLVSCYRGTVPPESVPASEITSHFRWLQNFFKVSLTGSFKAFEEASSVFDAAQSIYSQKEGLTKARFFFLTDGVARNVKIEDITIDDIEIKHYVWDMEKLFRFVSSGMQRTVIEIDFEKKFGGAVPCISMQDAGDEYRTFLAFFPGTLLAELYGEYGPRLLERNVRSYLQAKGNVNKGIRRTILEEPNRFLAYNNGISVTAQEIRLDKDDGQLAFLKWARDFQIVNGGQTTASIYHASRREDGIDLDKVSVQVKLTVLNDSEKINDFVPCISRYANSQNKVSAADLSANHPYHIKVEELSRVVWAPAQSGTELQTHWYYERARGSYMDDKARQGTPSQRKAFESKNPRHQKFTKTDLAKYENTWNQYPYLVCLGAEKNFIKFMELFIEKGGIVVNEDYFHKLMAKAILFRTAEKLISQQEYGGFRANIVTYTLACLFHQTAQRIDLNRIWQEQNLTQNLCDSIVIVSKYAYEHIISPPPERRNPGEWSKRSDCWETFRNQQLEIPKGLERELVDRNTIIREQNQREETSSDSNGYREEIQEVMKLPAEAWFRLAAWAKETGNLKPHHRSMAFNIGKHMKRSRNLSGKLAHNGVSILKEAERLGFKPF